jgi:hypothetical protein
MNSTENKSSGEPRDDSTLETLVDDREVISELLGQLLAREWMSQQAHPKVTRE